MPPVMDGKYAYLIKMHCSGAGSRMFITQMTLYPIAYKMHLDLVIRNLTKMTTSLEFLTPPLCEKTF